MKSRYLYLICYLLVSIIISSCNSYRQSTASKRTLGTALGVASGALIGIGLGDTPKQQAVDVALFSTMGGVIGATIGQNLAERDSALLNAAMQKALEYTPSGTKTAWHNPDSGNHGYIEPTKTWESRPQEYCREYTTKIVIGGKVYTGHGTACRRLDNSWEIISK